MIEIAIRPYGSVLFLTTSYEEYIAKRLTYTQEPAPIDEFTNAITSGYADDGVFVVGLFTATTKVLIHELGHVVIRTLCRAGVPINVETSEAFTYLLDDLYSECTAALNKELDNAQQGRRRKRSSGRA